MMGDAQFHTVVTGTFVRSVAPQRTKPCIATHFRWHDPLREVGTQKNRQGQSVPLSVTALQNTMFHNNLFVSVAVIHLQQLPAAQE